MTETALLSSVPPPHDGDAEQAVLGSILIEGTEAAVRCFSICDPLDFFHDYHQKIAVAMQVCLDRHEPIDLVTVSAELRRRSQLEDVGGGEYLTALMGEVPLASHLPRYTTIVAEKSVARRAIKAAQGIMQAAFANPEDVGALIKDAEKRFQRIASERIRSVGRLESMAERAGTIDSIIARAGEGRRPLSAARLGVPAVDERIGPLSDHGIILLKGNTGSGKSHIALHMAMSTATELMRRKEQGQVFIFSFESRGMYERRMIAWLSGINNEEIRRGFNGSAEPAKWERLWEAGEILKGMPIWLSERKNDQAHIEEEWMKALKRGPISLGILDYWQAMQKQRGRREIEEYAAATQTFRDIADDTGTPAVMVSQVTEHFGNKGGDSPGISKGSTDIQDASTLIMRLRKETLTCEKCRHGPEFGSTKIHIDYPTSRVYTLEEWEAMEARRAPPVQHREEPQEAAEAKSDAEAMRDVFGDND
jgi:replicative DNA helicase